MAHSSHRGCALLKVNEFVDFIFFHLKSVIIDVIDVIISQWNILEKSVENLWTKSLASGWTFNPLNYPRRTTCSYDLKKFDWSVSDNAKQCTAQQKHVRWRPCKSAKLLLLLFSCSTQNEIIFSHSKGGASEKLLKRSLHDAEEGLELRDDCGAPPVWLDKLEEAQYTISK